MTSDFGIGKPKPVADGMKATNWAESKEKAKLRAERDAKARNQEGDRSGL